MINWEILYNKLIETKSSEKGERHHIIPKHDGGRDENGLVILERRYHILAHYIRFRWKGQIGDRVSYQMMSGQLKHPLAGSKHKPETIEKMKISAKKVSHADRAGENHFRFGKPFPRDIAKKIGDSQRGPLNHRYGKTGGAYQRECARIANTGVNSPNSKKVEHIDTGLIFNCYADASNYFGVTKGTITYWVKKNQKFKLV